MSLVPVYPYERARMRGITRFADTFAYNAVYVLSWMRLSAPAARQLQRRAITGCPTRGTNGGEAIVSVQASVYLQHASGIRTEIRYYRNYAHAMVGLES
jgi:hypothetical protein